MNYYFYLWITDFEYYFHSKNYEKILLIFINCICLATWLLRQWGFKCAKIAYTFDWFKRLLQWISEQSKFEHYFMLCFQFIIIFISNTYIRYTLRSILNIFLEINKTYKYIIYVSTYDMNHFSKFDFIFVQQKKEQ
jgi:hypothetical protein